MAVRGSRNCSQFYDAVRLAKRSFRVEGRTLILDLPMESGRLV